MMSTDSTDAMSCREAVELLPWLVNGSLEAAEEAALRDHLAGCESCRVELEETADLWPLATWHIPSLDLAEYALGTAPETLDRGRIERHLALCPSCREELALVQSEPSSGQVIDFEAARAAKRSERRAPARWDWAVAATVAGALAAGGWAWSQLDLAGETSSGTVAKATPAEGAEPEKQIERHHPSHGGVVFSDGFESGSVVDWAEFESDEPSTEQRRRI